MKRAISLLVIVLTLPGVVLPQSGLATKIIQPSQTSVALNDQDVVELQRARLSPDELIARILSSKCAFDLSPAAVKSLLSAGVPDEVIGAMFKAMEAASVSETTVSPQRDQKREIVIPAGTPLDIESAANVDSFQVRPGELLSFRVLVPLRIDGVTVIDQDALVTASVVEAKRGGHWGRAGRLSWNLVDVVAVDGTRVPVRGDDVTKLKEQDLATSEAPAGASGKRKKKNGSVKGDSHSTEVATRTAVMGALLAPAMVVAPFLAPMMLLHGFKRGENAILPAHKRYVVFIGADARVKAFPWR
jgi:hypothetical protein